MYSAISKNYEVSFSIVVQIFAAELDFDSYTVGSVKRSSSVGERLGASLNQLFN